MESICIFGVGGRRQNGQNGSVHSDFMRFSVTGFSGRVSAFQFNGDSLPLKALGRSDSPYSTPVPSYANYCDGENRDTYKFPSLLCQTQIYVICSLTKGNGIELDLCYLALEIIRFVLYL